MPTQSNTDNMEYEVITLAAALGLISLDGDNVEYTKELGQEIKDKVASELSTSKIPTEVLAGKLSATLVAANPKLDIQKVGATLNDALRDIDINVKTLDDGLAAKAPANAAQAETIKPDERILRLEQALQQMVPALNALDTKDGVSISPKQETELPGVVDGFFDAKTQESFQGTMGHLNYLAELKKLDPPPEDNPLKAIAAKANALIEAHKVSKDQLNIFVPANADLIKEILVDGIKEVIEKKTVELKNLESTGDEGGLDRVSEEINKLTKQLEGIHSLIDDIADLQAEGKLSTPVDASKITVQIAPAVPEAQVLITAKSRAEAIAAAKASGSAITSERQINDINDDIQTVEGVLLAIGSKIENIETMGLASAIVTPLTPNDINDKDLAGNRVFGANSQDMFTKAVILIKTLGGEENPNGVYSHAVGERMKFQILTNPALEPLRQIEGLNIEKMEPGVAKAYLAKAEAILVELPEAATDARKAARATQKAELEAFEEKHHLTGLNSFMGSLDRLQDAGKLDPHKRAKEANTMNLIMDGINKFMPAGMMDSIKDFFLNTEIGKMIGGLLSMFGFNIGRLWGDKDDVAAIERAKPAIETGFDTFYKGAQKELGADASFNNVMAKTREEMLAKLENPGVGLAGKAQKYAFYKSMDMIFEGKGEAFIEGVVNKAMDAATAAGPAGAKAAFSQYIVDAGKQYQNGQDLDVAQINKLLSNADETITVAVKERPELANNNQSQLAVGTGLINTAGDQNVEMFYNRNTTVYEQDPMRFSPDMVAAMSGVMYSNNDKLGLTVAHESLRNSDGSYLEMMTPDFNVSVEELLVRAQIDGITEGGTKEITADQLKNLDHKLTADNIDVVRDYMVNEGVLQADIDTFNNSFSNLSADMRSTKDGSLQNISVWEQSQLPPQLKLDVSQFVPQAKPVTDMNGDNPLRDQYLEHNKDRPCETPLFIKNDDNTISVIIRDQNGTKSQSDDKFTKLELGDYERTRDIPDNVTRALLSNYKWENADEAGIRQHIDKIFCLDPVEPKITPELKSSFADALARSHAYPNDFNGLRTLEKGSELEQFVKNAFDEKGIDIGNKIESSFVNGPQYMLVELEQHGIKHDDIDVVVALRHNGKTHYAYVDYETDNIIPLSEQRERGLDDMSDRTQDPSSRRLDDVLVMIKDNPSLSLKDIQGLVGGYTSMISIVPNSIGGVSPVVSIDAVYGSSAVNTQQGALTVMNSYLAGGKIAPPPILPAHSPVGHTRENSRMPNDNTSTRDDTCGGPFSDFGENGPPVIGFLLNNFGDIVGKALGEFDCNDEIEQQMKDTTGQDAANDEHYNNNLAPVVDRSGIYITP